MSRLEARQEAVVERNWDMRWRLSRHDSRGSLDVADGRDEGTDSTRDSDCPDCLPRIPIPLPLASPPRSIPHRAAIPVLPISLLGAIGPGVRRTSQQPPTPAPPRLPRLTTAASASTSMGQKLVGNKFGTKLTIDEIAGAYYFLLLLCPVVSFWDCIFRKIRYSFRPEWV
ncbi:hypothetical protein EJB05_33946, partial [Eragrostis curvula]